MNATKSTKSIKSINGVNVMRALNKEDHITLLFDHEPYTPAVATDILLTFKRHGWVPPSEQKVYLDKWVYYKSLSNKSH